MKILGTSALNANNYRKISMYKNINVLGSSNTTNLKVSESLSKLLKGKTDQEKRDEVLRYFLRNHHISTIYEDSHDIVIQSKNGVELIIGRSQKLSEEVLVEALNKYDVDRMQTYAESDVDFYWMMSDYDFDSTHMGYAVGVVDDFHRELKGLPEELSKKRSMIIDIGLTKQYEKGELKNIRINPREKVFFEKMLSDISDAVFYCYSNDLFKNLLIYKCTINGKAKFLVIPRELGEFAYALDEKIEKERKEKNDCMRLQYKMEGF